MRRSLIAVLVCLLASACAGPRETISISYFPLAQDRPAGDARGSIYVTAVDARGLDPRAVAARLDEDGREIGLVHADKAVADIFREALEAELRARGFDVGAGGPGRTHVDVQVERFFNRARTGVFTGRATADIALTATVSSTPAAPSYTRRVTIEAKKPSARALGGTNDKLVLENGLADAIAELMDDHAFMGSLDAAAQTR
jgi:uncharacterized lipoprotein YajG